MSKTVRMNTLLAKTDHLGSSFKKGLTEYLKFFKDKQGHFRGERKGYTAREGMIDQPQDRKFERVITTVVEKLDYLQESSKDYIDALFSQEKTNAASGATVELVVDGISFGFLSALELLRLKSLLESSELEGMYASIPVRSETENWTKSSEDDYSDREIFETELIKGVKRSSTKEEYILPDPNLQYLKDKTTYNPVRAVRETPTELGDYTIQRFSGEYSHRQRAEILKRRTKLLTAVIESLKIVNEAEAIESDLTAAKLFGFLHFGKI